MSDAEPDFPIQWMDKEKGSEEQQTKEVTEQKEIKVPPETEKEQAAAETANRRTCSPDEKELEDGEVEDAPDDDEDGVEDQQHHGELASEQPPLPPGPPPAEAPPDDGWQPIWDDIYQAYYFYNTLTAETTWTNPRVPPSTEPAPDTSSADAAYQVNPLQYNPAIHGDYDPTAPYAQAHESTVEESQNMYTATAAFNRFTGKFQPANSRQVPENYSDENKSRRQMEFYFDVDAAANSHDGRSLKAERQTKRLSKKELKQYKEKRKQRKEEKRKAWLKD